MKAATWIIAGATITAALIYIIINAPEPAPSTGDPDVDRFANKATTWGAKQRVGGAGDSLVGKAKQAFGEATGDYDTADSGAGDQTAGAIRNAAGKVAGAVGDTVRDLNR